MLFQIHFFCIFMDVHEYQDVGYALKDLYQNQLNSKMRQVLCGSLCSDVHEAAFWFRSLFGYFIEPNVEILWFSK
jgi:hypothetical protein